jgi:hypothetical protein
MILASVTPPEWISESVWPVLVVQAVAGVIAMIGLYAIIKRFLAVEFPAAMREVNNRLEALHHDFESLERELRQAVIDLTRLKERVDHIKEKQDLDETGSRRRPPPQR